MIPCQFISAVIDLCHFGANEYLVAMDYYSRWIEVEKLSTTTTLAVVNSLSKMFSTHGIPETIVSDNGPQFDSQRFKEFTEEYDLIHITSSPHFPQANGLAESAVKIAKKLLKQKSLNVALMNYRSTVHSATGVSPAVALMGRQIRTKVPVLPFNLRIKSVKKREIRNKDGNRKQNYKTWFDRHHGARHLPPLSVGQKVLLKPNKEWQEPGTVIAAYPEKRTYFISTPRRPAKPLRRNRKHIQAVPDQVAERMYQIDPDPDPRPINYAREGDGRNVQRDNDAPNILNASFPPPSYMNTRSRSGYVAPKPARYMEEE